MASKMTEMGSNLKKISLCMIVRNEENNLRRCLASAQGFVDEMVVVDTGSTDSTVSIAREFGARIFCLTWQDDFSLARNFALAQARYDWLLVLDADDELRWQEVDKGELLGLGFDIYICRIINCAGSPLFQRETTHPQPRLFKKNAVKGYSGALHEQLVYQDSVKIAVAPMSIIHYGYFSPGEKDRTSRNTAILEKQVEKEPDNQFARYTLAMERFRQGRFEQACSEFAKLFNDVDRMGRGLVTELVRAYSLALMSLGDYEQAMDVTGWGRQHFPAYTDLVYLQARICYQMGDWVEAINLFRLCLEMGESPVDFCTAVGVGNRLPAAAIGDIFSRCGDYDKAVYWLAQAQSYYQEDISPLLKLTVAAVRRKGSEKFYSEIDKVCKIPREYWQHLVQALLEVGEAAAARKVLNDVGNLGVYHDYVLALVEFSQRQIKACKSRLEKMLKTATDAADMEAAAAQLCICCWVKSDWAGAARYLTLLRGSLARVYVMYHNTLTQSEEEHKGLKREDFQSILHILRQMLYANKIGLAKIALSLWTYQLNALEVVLLAQTLLRFGQFRWALSILQQEEQPEAEIEFLYGKACLACGKAGRAIKIFKNLVLEQPGFMPAYMGLVWGNLALAHKASCQGDLKNKAFQLQLDHWLRTGYLSDYA